MIHLDLGWCWGNWTTDTSSYKDKPSQSCEGRMPTPFHMVASLTWKNIAKSLLLCGQNWKVS